jgi:hypothetical protein
VSPRTGRPPKDNSMTERITVRLDNKCLEILQVYCQKNNVDKAEAIRIGIRSLEGK